MGTARALSSNQSQAELGPSHPAGMVTRLGDRSAPSAPPVAAAPDIPGPPPGTNSRRTLFWFGGASGLVVVIGLAVLLAVVLSGRIDPIWSRQSAPPDTRPPLAKLCPPPTAVPDSSPGAGTPAPAPSGPRTVDTETGISYRAYGAPWQPWNRVWTMGTLQVPYKMGQQFVTEEYGGGTYLASILSAAVPATENDGLIMDLACVGRQVAADVRSSYYPQPNQMELLRDEQTVLGGRPAWVTKFRLHFSETGLMAKDELAAVALIDVGRPQVAVLYVSIPGTHRQYDWVVDDVLSSVRPT
jgi:hypothetical protein